MYSCESSWFASPFSSAAIHSANESACGAHARNAREQLKHNIVRCYSVNAQTVGSSAASPPPEKRPMNGPVDAIALADAAMYVVSRDVYNAIYCIRMV